MDLGLWNRMEPHGTRVGTPNGPMNIPETSDVFATSTNPFERRRPPESSSTPPPPPSSPPESMDFSMLFEECTACSEGSCAVHREDASNTMYIRALDRLCRASDPAEQQVLALVQGSIAVFGCCNYHREILVDEIYKVLSNAGYQVQRMESRGSAKVLSHRHSYLKVTGDGESTPQAIIIDPRFDEEFQVVRPSSQYQCLLQSIPTTFVGTPANLAFVIELMTSRMEESFRKEGLSTPPWRQKVNLLSKWQLPGGRAEICAALGKPTFGHKVEKPNILKPAKCVVKEMASGEVSQPSLAVDVHTPRMASGAECKPSPTINVPTVRRLVSGLKPPLDLASCRRLSCNTTQQKSDKDILWREAVMQSIKRNRCQ